MTYFIVLAICGLIYNNYSLRQEQKQNRLQVAALAAQNQKLEKMIEKVNAKSPAIAPSPAASSQLKDLQSELGVEKEKLTSLLERRKPLLSSHKDNVQREQRRLDNLIQQRRDSIQAIHEQLQSARTTQLQIEQAGRQTQLGQSVSQVNMVQTFNQQIQSQEDQIKLEQTQVSQWKKSSTYDRFEKISALNAKILVQKQNIDQLRREKQLNNESESLQGKQIQNQMNVNKGQLQETEMQLRAQAESLSTEMKQLIQQRSSLQAKIRPDLQLDDLDQQINISQAIIRNLESAIKVR